MSEPVNVENPFLNFLTDKINSCVYLATSIFPDFSLNDYLLMNL